MGGGAAALLALGGGYGLARILGGGGRETTLSTPPKAKPLPRVEATPSLLLPSPDVPYRRRKFQEFYSRRDLTPPRIDVLVNDERRVADGLLFLCPNSGPGTRGPMIVDREGKLLWFLPVRDKTVINFRTALFHGEPVLTWWEGRVSRGLGDGDHVIFNRHYQELARFPAGGGRPADLHELQLTPRGTALVTSYEERTLDLRKLGGHREHTVIGGVVQEISIPSARVLFEWRSLDHVHPEESYRYMRDPYDYFHLNSIDLDLDGSLLVSARNTWCVYKIDRGTGEIVWRLGGKKSDFELSKHARFAWQHDARRLPSGRISLFDDEGDPQIGPQARAIILALDHKRKRATLAREYTHPRHLHAYALGGVQVLPNRNVLVSWGTREYFTEFTEDGTIVFDAKLPRGGDNYRVFRFPWVGAPKTKPRLVAHRFREHGVVVFASWNGATNVHGWELQTGLTPDELVSRGRRPREGFETPIAVPEHSRWGRVVAIDDRGHWVAASKTIRVGV